MKRQSPLFMGIIYAGLGALLPLSQFKPSILQDGDSLPTYLSLLRLLILDRDCA